MSLRRVVLTGPTGWIGTAFLAGLARTRGADWARSVTLFGSTERMILAPDGTELAVRRLDSLTGSDVADAHLVHLAYLTKDKVASAGVTGFMSANLAIDEHVLAACRRERPNAVFVASSGAARQAETGVGREPYGLSKLMQEDRFLTWSRKTVTPMLIGRIFSLAGPFINKLDSYALAVLLRQAFRDAAVRVEARTPVYRAYLHVDDLCTLVLAALDAGLGATDALDLSGGQVVEMEDLAREALRAAGHPQGRILRDAIDFDRPSSYFGDPTAARTLALRFGLKLRSFPEQIDDTASDLCARRVICD